MDTLRRSCSQGSMDGVLRGLPGVRSCWSPDWRIRQGRERRKHNQGPIRRLQVRGIQMKPFYCLSNVQRQSPGRSLQRGIPLRVEVIQQSRIVKVPEEVFKAQSPVLDGTWFGVSVLASGVIVGLGTSYPASGSSLGMHRHGWRLEFPRGFGLS
jgi:hypothetical protein